MKYLCIILSTLAYFTASSQTLEWVNQLGRNNFDQASGIVLDAQNNAYITGEIGPEIIFTDDGPQSTGSHQMMVAKYNDEGHEVWLQLIGDERGRAKGQLVAIDQHANLIVAGTFGRTVDFDPGPEENLLVSENSTDYFFAKYNSEGELIWAKSLADPRINGLEVDHLGNIYLTGILKGTADLDPSESEANFSSLNPNQYNIFLAKYTSQGEFTWAGVWESEGDDRGGKVIVDENGDIYLTGNIRGRVDLDFGSGTIIRQSSSTTGSNGFFAKYTNDGEFIWAEQIYSADFNGIYGMDLGSNQKIYLTGTFRGLTSFENTILPQSSSIDGFLAAYNTDGDFQWVNRIETQGSFSAMALALDPTNQAYVAGIFADSVTVTSPNQTAGFRSNGAFDFLLLKYNPNGHFVVGESFGGENTDISFDIVAGSGNNLWACGFFNDGVDFDPSEEEEILTTDFILEDAFIAKYHIPNMIEVPENDLCEQAIEVFCGQMISGSTTGASKNTEGCRGERDPGAGIGVWYKLKGNGKTVTVSNAEGSYARIDAFKGSCESLVCAGPRVGNNFHFLTEEGQDYFIYVSGSIDFTIDIECVSCDITDIQIPTSPYTAPTCVGGAGFIIPTAPAYGKYFACFDVIGEGLPPSNDQYKVVVDHIEYPVIVSQYSGPEKVTLCVANLPDQRNNIDVFIRVLNGCTWNEVDLYDAPNCEGIGTPPCNITDISVSSGPTCNENGGYDICFFIEGVGFPENQSYTKIVTDHIEREVSSIQVVEGGWEVCVEDIPADGVADIEVFFRTIFGCTYTAYGVYDEPSCKESRLGRSKHQFFELSPNPFEDVLHIIAGDIQEGELLLYNSINQIVHRQLLNPNTKNQVNLIELPAGIYFARLRGIDVEESKEVLQTVKIIKR